MSDTLGSLGERAVIERLAPLLTHRPDVVVGLGDDAAVVRTDGAFDLLFTADPVVEGTHFLPGTEPEWIGHKVVGRSLSDIAAMGGEPLWALIDVVAPKRTAMERLEGIYRGAAALARRHSLALVGGDTSGGEPLQLHLFMVGRVPRDRAVLRAGAETGDVLFVTGALGGSLAGRHLSFEPRVEAGLWMRRGGWARAMIDVSDGLATDLRHVLDRSGKGAEIDLRTLPLTEAARRADDGRSPAEHALFDGEDFELLFTVAPERRDAFESAWAADLDLPCTAIGRITEPAAGLCVRTLDGSLQPLDGSGFEHFRSDE